MKKYYLMAMGLTLVFTACNTMAAGVEAAHAAAAGGMVVNMADYGVPDTVTTKYFTRERTGFGCDRIKETYERNAGDDGTETWLIFENTGDNCERPFFQVQMLQSRDGGLYLLGQTHGSSGDINVRQTFDSPLLVSPSQAFIGQMWSDATRVRFPGEEGNDGVIRAARINGTVTARISSMTIGDMTWNDCISVLKDYAGDSFRAYGHGFVQTQYYCRGIGEVKRIRIYNGGPSDPSYSELRELTGSE